MESSALARFTAYGCSMLLAPAVNWGRLESVMQYTLLRGSFVIRYPDLPRQGPEPDGDTIKFLPDTPALV